MTKVENVLRRCLAVLPDCHDNLRADVLAALAASPPKVESDRPLRCEVESNETGCLHPKEHRGRCGYSLPNPAPVESGVVE